MGDFNDFLSPLPKGIESEEALQKALSAGHVTDSAMYTGGRAIIPEDIELTMLNVLRERKEDCKLMNMLKKTPVASTVHEYNLREDVGDYEGLAVAEGMGSETNDQTIRRVVRSIKFLQDRRAVTDQMSLVNTFEDAYTSEKIAGTINILRAAEYLCFQGDAAVVPEQFDGLLKQIESSTDANVMDVRGKTIEAMGETVITEPVRAIYEQGGDANKLFMPPILAQDIQDLVKDRIRFGTVGSTAMSLVVDQYPTPYGSTVHFGETEGADKFFRVKGLIHPRGQRSTNRPASPSNVTASTGTDTASKFLASDAGNYKYSVYSINYAGISEEKELTGAVAVAAGGKVTLSITASVEGKETGYIIARSSKDGDVLMEMVRIPKNQAGNITIFEDYNEDLPGTAKMVLITERNLDTVIQWCQLCALRVRPLYESNRAEMPFFIQLFGALDVKAPQWCAVVKNIQYKGGLTY